MARCRIANSKKLPFKLAERPRQLSLLQDLDISAISDAPEGEELASLDSCANLCAMLH